MPVGGYIVCGGFKVCLSLPACGVLGGGCGLGGRHDKAALANVCEVRGGEVAAGGDYRVGEGRAGCCHIGGGLTRACACGQGGEVDHVRVKLPLCEHRRLCEGPDEVLRSGLQVRERDRGGAVGAYSLLRALFRACGDVDHVV